MDDSLINVLYRLSGNNDYRVATFSKSYLTVGIRMQSLKWIGQF